MTSATLKTVLETLLVIGNVLNTGTSYGNADGFRLETLLKLHDVKVRYAHPVYASNGSLSRVCQALNPDLVTSEELISIEQRYIAIAWPSSRKQ